MNYLLITVKLIGKRNVSLGMLMHSESLRGQDSEKIPHTFDKYCMYYICRTVFNNHVINNSNSSPEISINAYFFISV